MKLSFYSGGEPQDPPVLLFKFSLFLRPQGWQVWLFRLEPLYLCLEGLSAHVYMPVDFLIICKMYMVKSVK